MTAHTYRPTGQTNNKDWQGDIRRKIVSPPPPELPSAFIQVDDCHWQISHDDVTCVLWYDVLMEQWSIRFEDWPTLVAGFYNTFPRDIPALEMREQIVAAIDGRYDTWLTEGLPQGELLSETAPGCYGLGAGEY